jgi:hypothetical protein
MDTDDKNLEKQEPESLESNTTDCAAGCNCEAPAESDPADCGPGCNCEAPPSRKRMKLVVSIIVLLAAGSILAYKGLSTKQDDSNINLKSASAFNVDQTTLKPKSSSVNRSVPQKAERRFVRTDKPVGKKRSTTDSPNAGRKIGENLESMNALNEVAIDHDAVFIYIPLRSNTPVSDKINTAVLDAQQTLESKDIKLGLFTLPTSSPDYTSLSAQIRPPAILIASKGKGMTAVTGEVTEEKLLQAFVSCSSAGGCGPSGCGPSTPGCK